MWTTTLVTVFLAAIALALELDYLDPMKLQTVTSAKVQQRAALTIIRKYTEVVKVKVNHDWFKDNKDYFSLNMRHGVLHIKASTGVAAVWGFNYYLKKYCNSQIGWQTERVNIPNPLPPVTEEIVANDRFRYYQDSCTQSYSFVWWNIHDWMKHIAWMALNGINLTLAPVAQEAIWARVYRNIGMTQAEIDKHFTGPAFLAWLRMGNMHGWGGPLPQSWHESQSRLQYQVIDALLNLGIAPVLPAFNGHVPVAFKRVFQNQSFYNVEPWGNFSVDYSSGLFMRPTDPMFKVLGMMFLAEMGSITGCHIYISDPFNEVDMPNFSTRLVTKTATKIFETIAKFDSRAVWLIPNWAFISRPDNWPTVRVKEFLRAVPKERVLVLDQQAETSPRYATYDMYFGRPFIWCMLHNFGGTLGMHGNLASINKDVHKARSIDNSTMIGIGLTPEGINQNYVVYDLMLESAWRKTPVNDLEAWVTSYADRRYGCNKAAEAWKYLLKSIYSYTLPDGKHAVTVTRKPSFDYSPWVWYKSTDFFSAFGSLIFINDRLCDSEGYRYDVVDVTRQFLQYKIEQLFLKIVSEKTILRQSDATVQTFLKAFDDMSLILATNVNFLAASWFTKAKALGISSTEADLYEYNAWNQITRFGPNGELNDYAGKQWSEMITYYYRPGWAKFLNSDAMAMDTKKYADKPSSEETDEDSDGNTEEHDRRKRVIYNAIDKRQKSPLEEARRIYYRWIDLPGTQDLPILTDENQDPLSATTSTEAEYDSDENTEEN